MEEKIIKEIALLKYSIIAPVVTDTYTTPSKIEHFRNESMKKYTLSNGMPFSFAPMTATLIPKNRCDMGKLRSLSPEAITRIREIKNQFPHITGTLVYQKFIEENTINKSNTSFSKCLFSRL